MKLLFIIGLHYSFYILKKLKKFLLTAMSIKNDHLLVSVRIWFWHIRKVNASYSYLKCLSAIAMAKISYKLKRKIFFFFCYSGNIMFNVVYLDPNTPLQLLEMELPIQSRDFSLKR